MRAVAYPTLSLLLIAALAACGGSSPAMKAPAASDPAITSQPLSTSVAIGAQASFSVSASGSSPLSYQWHKNGGAIAGATTDHYTTPAASAADNGTSFSVTITDSAGSVTSAAAVLTVTGA